MKNYPPQFKADAVALYQSRPERRSGRSPPIWGSTPRPYGTGSGRPVRAGPGGAGRRCLPSRRHRWRRRTPLCGRRSVSWRKSAKSCGRRRSISPGRRAGEPLPVRRRPSARYGVKRLCTIVGIARSSFYYWRRTAADPAVRQAADARLAARIRACTASRTAPTAFPRNTYQFGTLSAFSVASPG